MYKIPLSRPSYMSFAGDVCKAVDAVIRSGDIAQGSKVAEFEERITAYVGTKYAVAVSSGTAGLFLCLKACGISRGDEVITTPFTFIATVNSILWTGARPVFCDIDRETYNMDDNKLHFTTKTSRVKCLLPVDIFGVPVDTRKMEYTAYDDKTKHLPIIIDSCESLGSRMDRPFDCCVFAFYPNKQLTTGEGGIICTNNADIADYCRAARNHGRLPGDTGLNSSMMGYNFRMTDIQAAIGIEQLKRIDEIICKRLCVYERYLGKLPENLVKYPRWDKTPMKMFSPFVFTVEVENRDKVMQCLLSKGIECRPYFPAVHLMKCMDKYGYEEGDFPVAEKISSKTLALPFFADMTEMEIDYVCEKLREVLA